MIMIKLSCQRNLTYSNKWQESETKKMKYVVLTAAAAFGCINSNISSICNARASEPYSVRYQKGYGDACRYGQMAEGSHTDAYVAGFNAGLQRCSNNNNHNNNRPNQSTNSLSTSNSRSEANGNTVNNFIYLKN